ncbi:M48 family metallopeptidase [Pontibacter sp. G13]|uniref:M48 family metallopeptidase n=1 Tax=Pontibacter sp. G13 TaxID=3074898 RepID=UPI00288C4CDF|nr:M48 family metallopeptidase [Pontibacter sp. G13]WNJ21183.1 M48 family metallopeptidase [Pontibacter sp. G13]
MILNLPPYRIPVKVLKAEKPRIQIKFLPESPELIIISPTGTFSESVRAFIQQKERWIRQHYPRNLNQHNARQQFHQKLKAHQIQILGTERAFQFTPSRREHVKLTAKAIEVEHVPFRDQKDEMIFKYNALRTLAKPILTQRTHQWAAKTQSRFNQVRVKDHKSKWGSCSNKDNINLNWHLILLPEILMDYVIVHELMHLRVFNHSPEFWQEVARYMPNYQQYDHDLETYRWMIGIFEPFIR